MAIPDVLPVILLCACVLYSGTVIVLLLGLRRTDYHPLSERPFVSVIVAARNEERFIHGLLESLLVQSYPHYEIIIIDDRSSDRTADIVQAVCADNPRVTLIRVSAADPVIPAKKNALSVGIRAAKGDILAFTDADCQPPPRWIEKLVDAFSAEVGLVAGFSPYDIRLASKPTSKISHRLFQGFIWYEELKAAIWSWGAIGIGKGWLCTGRNLAYRKEVWNEVGGFDRIKHSISGDDDLFLQLVRRATTWKIGYAESPDCHVPTAPPETLSQFLQQRKRHFSAARYFPFSMKMFFTAFHTSNILLYAGCIIGLLSGSLSMGIGFFAFKTLMDLVFIVKGAARLGIQAPIFSFFLMEFVYAIYNAVVGPSGLFGSFKWKPHAG